MKNKAVKTYLDSVAYNKLAQEAHVRNKSLSETIQCCLQEYLEIRREMASAFEVPSKLGDEHAGKIIHTILSRSELRFAEQIQLLDKKILSVSSQLESINIILDKVFSLVKKNIAVGNQMTSINHLEKKLN